MRAYLSIFCFLAGLCSIVNGAAVLGPNTWAVLIAGSKGWSNYRHQASICHAYHSLIKKGVQREKIITLIYDDVVNDRENPEPGTLINKPDGKDVYHGVQIDYRGEDITPANFLHILEGNEEAMKNIGNGRVLKSTENDTVFVNFVDHGGPGVFCFPHTLLKASDFVATLNVMSNKNMFEKLILYIEACYSGSMFDNLISHLPNVFASTSAAYDESSYACYCDEKKWSTCLASIYSLTWMERLDKLNSSESLFDNFNALRSDVRTSHVQIYGDYRLGFQELFESGNAEGEPSSLEHVPFEKDSVVNSRDIPLYMARKKLLAAKDPGSIIVKKEKLQNMIKARNFADKLISKILDVYTEGDVDSKSDLESTILRLHPDMLTCYDDLIDAFETNCFKIPENTYFLKHLYKFSNICVEDLVSTKAAKAIETVCREKMLTVNNIAINIE